MFWAKAPNHHPSVIIWEPQNVWCLHGNDVICWNMQPQCQQTKITTMGFWLNSRLWINCDVSKLWCKPTATFFKERRFSLMFSTWSDTVSGLFFYFNWSMADLQCCVSFKCTAKGFNYTYLFFFRFFPLWVITQYWVVYVL